MFQNVGKKLQVIATILFWVATAASVVLAFVFGIDRDFYHYRNVFNAGIFFAFLLGGPTVAYFGSLILHGFGSIVSDHEEYEYPEEKVQGWSGKNVNWLNGQNKK
jgi:hypothetical protein